MALSPTLIRPKDLTPRPTPVASEIVPSDNGDNVGGSTWLAGVNAARPFASQAEAEAGTSATKGMSPLTTAQAIAALGGASFATAAQGATADSAVQPGDLASVATSGAYADLSGRPTLGTAAAENVGAFATAAQGSLADTAIQRYSTRSALVTATIPATAVLINTDGFASTSDSGKAAYKRATLFEIQSAFGMVETDVLFYAPLTGLAGAVSFTDYSRYNHVLTTNGQTNIDGAQTVYGLPMAHFDGNGDLVSAPDNPIWAFPGDFTVHFQLRCEDLAATRFLFGQNTNSTNYYAMAVTTAGAIYFRQVEAGVTTIDVTSANGAVSANTTGHCALVRLGNDYTIYLNGVAVATATDSTAIADFTGTFRVGSFSTVGHMKGWIGDFWVLNYGKWLTNFTPADQVVRYPSLSYFRTLDRYTPAGATDATQGGYWLLDVPEASPKMLGAADDPAFTTDVKAILQAARDYCCVRHVPLRIDGYFYCLGPLRIDFPLQIVGMGRMNCGIRFRINPSSFEPGLHIMAPNVSVSDVQLDASATQTITNGEGFYGTCATVGEGYMNPAFDPVKVRNVTFERILFSRAPDTGAAHAFCQTGRSSHVSIEDSDFDGYPEHGNAILAHWGAHLDPLDFTTSLILPPFLPHHFSHHPNNLRVRNIRLRGCGRLAALSACYDIDIDGVDMQGDGQGSQLIDLPVGDEGDTFAHPDDQGKVYRGFSLRNLRAKFLNGNGANSITAIDCSGFCTSKQTDASLAAYASAPYTTEVYAGRVQKRTRQMEWKEVVFDNVTFDYGPRAAGSTPTTDQTVYLRNLLGQFTFRNVYFQARDGVRAVYLANCIGEFRFDSCKFYGTVKVQGVSNIGFYNCQIEQPLITTGTAAIEVSGAMPTYTKDAGTTAIGATLVTFTAALTHRFLIGQPISYTGGTVYVTEYAEVGDTSVKVSPLPAAAAAGATFTLDQRTRGITFHNCDVKGGSRAYDVADTINANIAGGFARAAGQYGILVGSGSQVNMMGTVFSNNGLRRAFVPADSALSTRDIAVAAGAVFNARGLRFENSTYILHNISATAGFLAFCLEDSMFIGSPITGKFTMGAPVGTAPAITAHNVDASGNTVP